MRTARLFGVGLLLGAADDERKARAQDYPAQTIKLIVPFMAGGPVDALARVVAQHLQTRLGQNVIVENRSGGGTSIGAKAVAAAAPDGYTLLVVGPNIAYYPVLFPNLDFDPTKALDAGRNPGDLVASDRGRTRGAGQHHPASWSAYAKANPGKLAFGFGLATMPHIIGEIFKKASGHRYHRRALSRRRRGARRPARRPRPHQHRTGAAASATDPRRQDPGAGLHGRAAQPRIAGCPHHDRERLSARSAFNPDVWMGVLAPAGTPAAIVDRLNRDINAVLKSEEMAPSLKRFGYEAKITTPAEFKTFFAGELQKWPPILKATGIKPQ